MISDISKRPRLACRLARGIPGRVLVRRRKRHETKCDYCRQEQAELEKVLSHLRYGKRLSAPPSLYSDVMSQIAQERKEMIDAGGVNRRRQGRIGPPGPSTDKLIYDMIPLLILLGSWLLVIPTVPFIVDRLSGIAEGAVSTVRHVNGGIVHGLKLFAEDIVPATVSTGAPGIAPVFSALVWCGIGWGVAIAIQRLTTRSVR